MEIMVVVVAARARLVEILLHFGAAMAVTALLHQ
jgi:hypothetical protein